MSSARRVAAHGPAVPAAQRPRALLEGPLRFTPVVDGQRREYRFAGAIALDRLIAGVIDLPTLTGVASPTGTALALDAEIALTWEVAA